MLGEIDCRTGLIAAVEKLKYPDLDAARGSLALLYSQILLDLLTQRQLAALWVSCVPPVLDETRAMVTSFNAVLEEQVWALQAAHLLCCLWGQSIFSQIGASIPV